VTVAVGSGELVVVAVAEGVTVCPLTRERTSEMTKMRAIERISSDKKFKIF